MKGKTKKGLSLLLALVMVMSVFSSIPMVANASADNLTYAGYGCGDTTVTFNADGSIDWAIYHITNIGLGKEYDGFGVWLANDNTRLVVNGGTHYIQLNGDTISTTTDESIIDIKAGTVYLDLAGTSTLTSADDAPCIHVAEGANLIITGSGTLNATANGDGAGIGAKGHYAITGETCGNITINSGTINATANWGAGIGGGSETNASNITINGGTVNATASAGRGIGGGYNGTTNGTIKVNGGTVTAKGGFQSAIQKLDLSGFSKPYVAYGSSKTSNTMTADVSNTALFTSAGYVKINQLCDTHTSYTKSTDGKTHYVDSCSTCGFTGYENCDFTYTDTGDGKTCTKTCKCGYSETADLTWALYGGDTTIKFNEDGSVDWGAYHITNIGLGKDKDGFSVVSPNDNTRIVVNGGTHYIQLWSANINTTGTESPIDIKAGTVYLDLYGDSVLTSADQVACIHVAEGANLIIRSHTGTGSLTATAASSTGGAAIGANGRFANNMSNAGETAGNITIDSGTVNANACWGAGLGGGQETNASNITINGGTVNAYSTGAYGIGGGVSGSTTGTIKINGGTVTATAWKNLGQTSLQKLDLSGFSKPFVSYGDSESEATQTLDVSNISTFTSAKYFKVISLCDTHTYTYTKSTDGKTHKATCSVCGYSETRDCSFEYTDNKNGTHTKTCKDCGYSETNNCDFAIVNNNNGTHTRTCKDCGYSVTSDCDFTITNNNNGTHTRTCKDCGYTVTENCDFTITDNKNGTHTKTCKDCGYTVTEDCHYSNFTNNNNGTHTRTCTDCGNSETKDCEYTYTAGENKTHTKTCKDCGCSATENCNIVNGVCTLCNKQYEINYINRTYNESTKTVEKAVSTATDYKTITSDLTNWESGTYVASKDTTINDRITMTGDIKLIIPDGVTLNFSNGCVLSSGGSLSIYSGENDTGKLVSMGPKLELNTPGIDADGATLTISGGNITVVGGYSSNDYAIRGTTKLLGGTLIANGQSYSAFCGDVLVYGGSISAVGATAFDRIPTLYGDYKVSTRTDDTAFEVINYNNIDSSTYQTKYVNLDPCTSHQYAFSSVIDGTNKVNTYTCNYCNSSYREYVDCSEYLALYQSALDIKNADNYTTKYSEAARTSFEEAIDVAWSAYVHGTSVSDIASATGRVRDALDVLDGTVIDLSAGLITINLRESKIEVTQNDEIKSFGLNDSIRFIGSFPSVRNQSIVVNGNGYESTINLSFPENALAVRDWGSDLSSVVDINDANVNLIYEGAVSMTAHFDGGASPAIAVDENSSLTLTPYDENSTLILRGSSNYWGGGCAISNHSNARGGKVIINGGNVTGVSGGSQLIDSVILDSLEIKNGATVNLCANANVEDKTGLIDATTLSISGDSNVTSGGRVIESGTAQNASAVDYSYRIVDTDGDGKINQIIYNNDIYNVEHIAAKDSPNCSTLATVEYYLGTRDNTTKYFDTSYNEITSIEDTSKPFGPHFYVDGTCKYCGAEAPEVNYIDRAYSEESKGVVSTASSVQKYTTVSADDTEWTSGWYVVSNNTTIPERVEVSGDVHLIVEDGVKLTAQKGISVPEHKAFTVYGQNNDTGVLEANATYQGSQTAIGYYGYCGTITINGATITGTTLDGPVIGCSYDTSGNIYINGGNLDIYGPSATMALSGVFHIYGGNILVRGGRWQHLFWLAGPMDMKNMKVSTSTNGTDYTDVKSSDITTETYQTGQFLKITPCVTHSYALTANEIDGTNKKLTYTCAYCGISYNEFIDCSDFLTAYESATAIKEDPAYTKKYPSAQRASFEEMLQTAYGGYVFGASVSDIGSARNKIDTALSFLKENIVDLANGRAVVNVLDDKIEVVQGEITTTFGLDDDVYVVGDLQAVRYTNFVVNGNEHDTAVNIFFDNNNLTYRGWGIDGYSPIEINGANVNMVYYGTVQVIGNMDGNITPGIMLDSDSTLNIAPLDENSTLVLKGSNNYYGGACAISGKDNTRGGAVTIDGGNITAVGGGTQLINTFTLDSLEVKNNATVIACANANVEDKTGLIDATTLSISDDSNVTYGGRVIASGTAKNVSNEDYSYRIVDTDGDGKLNQIVYNNDIYDAEYVAASDSPNCSTPANIEHYRATRDNTTKYFDMSFNELSSVDDTSKPLGPHFYVDGSCKYCGAEAPEVNFIDREYNEDSNSVISTTSSTKKYITVTSDLTEWTEGTYVVSNDTSIDPAITMTGDINLIIEDGATLHTYNGITVNGTLTIYSEENETGKFIAEVPRTLFYVNALGGSGKVVLDSGNLEAVGGWNADNAIECNFTVLGGTVNVDGGNSLSIVKKAMIYGGTVTTRQPYNESPVLANGLKVSASTDGTNYTLINRADITDETFTKATYLKIEPCSEHNYVETVVDPTCYSKGYTNHTCSLCGDSYNDSYVDESHEFELTKRVAPTYVTDGYEEYKCSLCGKIKTAVLSATGNKALDYDALDAAIKTANALDKNIYTAESYNALMDAVSVDMSGATEQSEIDRQTTIILSLINSLEKNTYEVTFRVMIDGEKVTRETKTYQYGDLMLFNANKYDNANASKWTVTTDNSTATTNTNKKSFSLLAHDNSLVTVYLTTKESASPEMTEVRFYDNKNQETLLGIQYVDELSSVDTSKVTPLAKPFYEFAGWKTDDGGKTYYSNYTYHSINCMMIAGDNVTVNDEHIYFATYDEVVRVKSSTGASLALSTDGTEDGIITYLNDVDYINAPKRSEIYVIEVQNRQASIGITGNFTESVGEKTKVSVNGQFYIPDDATLVETGILTSISKDNNSEETLIVGGKKVVKLPANIISYSNEFTVSVTSTFNSASVLYTRNYMIYKDADGEHTVYSNIANIKLA